MPSKPSHWAIAASAIVALGLILWVGTRDRDAGRRIRYVPITRKITSGRVTIKPRDGIAYPFEITPEMHDAQVVGNFTAYGGSNNTVAAVLTQPAAYESWIQGNDSSAYYSSGGQKDRDQFAVRLDPGMYTFGISNRVSKSGLKYVFLDLELIYYKAERY